ncbi:glycosyltransferase family 2 protein [Planctomycetota bacterium]
MANQALVTIVTVCHNSAATIPPTIDSVLEQDYGQVEYLVIDGASSDGTLDIAKDYRSRAGGRMRVVSEPDRGIYDAMNKGIVLSTGEILYFLNCGDRLASPDVLSRVVTAFRGADCDFLYGNVHLTREDRVVERRVCGQVDKRYFLNAMICHQAVFCRRWVFRRTGPFDARLPNMADLDWMLRCFSDADVRCCYRDLDIAYYDYAGVTSMASTGKRRYAEYRRIVFRHFSLPVALHHFGSRKLRSYLPTRG